MVFLHRSIHQKKKINMRLLPLIRWSQPCLVTLRILKISQICLWIMWGVEWHWSLENERCIYCLYKNLGYVDKTVWSWPIRLQDSLIINVSSRNQWMSSNLLRLLALPTKRINLTLIFNLGLVRHAKRHPKFLKHFIVGF